MTLPSAIETINAVGAQPDFIVFTGDLTHTTDDAAVRRKRMTEFRRLAGGLKVKTLRFLPGEHDAAKDAGGAFQEHFGAAHYTFDHKGVHFVALDNVVGSRRRRRDAQIDWLARRSQEGRPRPPVVVLTHRPLFDLYPEWEWSTKDGAKVIDVLLAYRTSRSSTVTSTRSTTTRPNTSRTTPPARWSSRCRRPARCRRRRRPPGTRLRLQGARLPARHRRRSTHRRHRAAGRPHDVALTASIFRRRPSCPHRPSCHRRRSCPRLRPQPFQMQSQRMRLPAIVHTPQLWQAVAWRQAHDATPLQAAGRS